ncbi:rCG42110 [Rattus norvegicus]|uniref:RCG42110 n=1 Tax=Rattus norvegicus TaxID=10116 RepID=A6JUS9_RAT|nr:rCG42110 [Rattus norvegicus]
MFVDKFISVFLNNTMSCSELSIREKL